MTEFIREPALTEIIDEKPEFTWIVPSEFGFQEAYRILVASSPELLAENSGDMCQKYPVPSQQWVQSFSFGRPIASTMSSIS